MFITTISYEVAFLQSISLRHQFHQFAKATTQWHEAQWHHTVLITTQFKVLACQNWYQKIPVWLQILISEALPAPATWHLVFTIRENEMKRNVPGELPMPCMPTEAAMLPVLLAPELLGMCWYAAMPVELPPELIPASTRCYQFHHQQSSAPSGQSQFIG